MVTLSGAHRVPPRWVVSSAGSSCSVGSTSTGPADGLIGPAVTSGRGSRPGDGGRRCPRRQPGTRRPAAGSSPADAFACACSTERAPGMTVVTPGCCTTQASATWAGVASIPAPATSSENSRAASTPVAKSTPEKVSPTSNGLALPVVGAVVVGGERGVGGVAAAQQATRQRHPGDDADPVRGGRTEHVVQRLAPERVQDDLHGGRAAARHRGQSLVAGLDTHPVRRDGALLDQGVEIVVRLVAGQHTRRRAVQLDQVEPVGPQVAPRAVDPAAEVGEGVVLGHLVLATTHLGGHGDRRCRGSRPGTGRSAARSARRRTRRRCRRR